MEWWKRLDPKQRKIAIAALGGGALALFVLMSRRQPADAVPSSTDPTAAPAGVDPSATLYPDAGPSSFADNGSGFGQLSTAVADSIGQVTTSLDDLNTTVGGQGEAISGLSAGVAAATAAANAAKAAAAARPPAQLGNTGQPAGKPKSPLPKRFGGHPLSFWKKRSKVVKGRRRYAWPNHPNQYVHTRPYAGR